MSHTVSPGGRRSSLAPGSSRRSSSEVIKRMLYGSATKEDLKNRDNLDTEAEGCTSESDTSLHSDTDSPSSPAPGPPRYSLKKTVSASRLQQRGRRNSVEDSSDIPSSPSPPLSLEKTQRRQDGLRGAGGGSCRTLPRRTKSSSNTSLAASLASQHGSSRKTSYAFGSSTERFSSKQEQDARSSQDNLSGAGSHSPHFITDRASKRIFYHISRHTADVLFHSRRGRPASISGSASASINTIPNMCRHFMISIKLIHRRKLMYTLAHNNQP